MCVDGLCYGNVSQDDESHSSSFCGVQMDVNSPFYPEIAGGPFSAETTCENHKTVCVTAFSAILLNDTGRV